MEVGLVHAIRCAFLLLLGAAALCRGGETDTLRARLAAEWAREDASTAQSSLAAQGPDGAWPDIDYSSRDRTNWDCARHLYRLRSMATAFNQPGHAAFRSPAMRSGVSKGLGAWFAKKPVSDNWFWNQIGPQNELAPILLSMFAQLTPAQITEGASFFAYRTGWTGQNKVWFASQLIFRGCLLQSQADVEEGVALILPEIAVSTGEGIQPDFSFHQHGAMLYTTNYGFSFIRTLAPLAQALHGLSFGFPEAKERLLIRYLLEGTQWMLRHGNWGVGAHGREISRPNGAASSVLNGTDRALGDALRQALSFAGPEQAAVQAFADHVAGGADGALTGNKHFRRSDFMAHRRAGYLATLRMCSIGIKCGEAINGENRKGGYLAFGSLFPQVRGDEYRTVFPVWDWSRIPGVTSPHKAAIPSANASGATDFVGGVSDGTYGAAVMDLDRDGVTGRKSWFFFDREVVALGCGIASAGADTVITSVNQVTRGGEAWAGALGGPGGAAPSGYSRLKAPGWAQHDSIGYLFPAAGEVRMGLAPQTGDWASINANYPSAEITQEVFSLWFEHGPRPKDGAYAYVLVPGISRTGMAAYARSAPARILSNTASLQAAANPSEGVTGAVFHVPGEVEAGQGAVLKVDKPCLALIRIANGKAFLSLSNPLATALTVKAVLTVQGAGAATLEFDLPGDAATGGSSLTREFGIRIPVALRATGGSRPLSAAPAPQAGRYRADGRRTAKRSISTGRQMGTDSR